MAAPSTQKLRQKPRAAGHRVSTRHVRSSPLPQRSVSAHLGGRQCGAGQQQEAGAPQAHQAGSGRQEPHTAYLKRATPAAPERLRTPYHTPAVPLSGFCKRRISQRIRAAARAMGLFDKYSVYSGPHGRGAQPGRARWQSCRAAAGQRLKVAFDADHLCPQCNGRAECYSQAAGGVGL